MAEYTINQILQSEITVVDYRLNLKRRDLDPRKVYSCLSRIIDNLGELSAVDQQLNSVITSMKKLEKFPDHQIYLLKDANASNGNGEIIGYLKTGWKHLYLYNNRQEIFDVTPLCLLDFYISKTSQRHGYGKRLFDFMLHNTQHLPQKIAIDGPSVEMIAFLNKYYGDLEYTIQPNNFAISKYFVENSGIQSSASTPRTNAVERSRQGRFAAHKPHSSVGEVIHGANSSCDSASRASTPRHTPVEAEAEPEAIAPAMERPSSLDLKALEVAAEQVFEQPPVQPEQPSGSHSPTEGSPPAAGCLSTRRRSQLSDKGYFDIKNYHNKLW